MYTNSIIVAILLILAGKAFAMSPDVIALAQETKNQIRTARTFNEKQKAVEELKSKLLDRAQALYKDKERLESRIEELERNLKSLPIATPEHASAKRQFDNEFKKFTQVAREYYDYIEFDNFLSLIPPFNGRPVKKPKDCEDAVKHIRGVTTPDGRLKIEPDKTDYLYDLRYQAIVIGKLLYECNE